MPILEKDMMPIRVRGVVYENAKVACKALGIRRGTLYTHIAYGTLDKAGLGMGSSPNSRNGGGSHVKAVKIGPYEFRTQYELDRYIGRKRGYTSGAIKKRDAGKPTQWNNLVRQVMEKKAKEDRAAQKEIWDRKPIDAHYI